MTVQHMYFPSPGQADAVARAAALNCVLVPASLANDLRYATIIPSLPCVVCDHGDDLVAVPEPTTLAQVGVAHDALLEEHVPTTVAHTAAQVTATAAAIAAHASAVNPHSLTPGTIGAATAAHVHVDADLPAGLARDAEVAAGYSPLAHTHSYEPSGTVATHAAAADPHPVYLTAAEGVAAYSDIAHTHGVPSAGVMRVANAQTMTATAQTAVTGMSFAAAANATYYFTMEIVISTSTGTAPTTAWGFTGPASPTAVGIAMTQDTSTSVQVDATITSFTAFAAGAQVAATGVKFSGVVQTSAGNAGTVALTAARAGTTPSMVVAAGSNGMWMRVA